MDFFDEIEILAGSAFLTTGVCLILAFLVFAANPHSKVCRLTTLFKFSVAFWSFCYGAMFVSEGLNFLAQLITISILILSALFTHLVLALTLKDSSLKKLIAINYLVAVLISILTLSSAMVVNGVSFKLGYPSYVNAGPYYFLCPLFLFANLIFSSAYLIFGIKRSTGSLRQQMSLFLVGSMIGFISGSSSYFLVYDIPIKPILSPFVIFYPLIVAYAIIRYQFLDIQKLIKNTLIFICLFIGLLFFAAWILFLIQETTLHRVGLSEPLAQAIVIVLAMALYAPLKTGLTRITHQFLFQRAYHPEVIFSKLSEDILFYLEPQFLAREVTQRISRILSLNQISLYRRSKNRKDDFHLLAGVGDKLPQRIKASSTISELTHNLMGIRPTMGRNQSLKKSGEHAQATREMEDLGYVAAFPILTKKHLHAILFLGRKKSDVAWSVEELDIVESFTSHLSLALSNAEHADEIRKSRKALTQNEREATAGALIAGIEHEVRNPLHTMSLSLSALQTFLRNPKTSNDQALDRVNQTMADVLDDIGLVSQIIEHLSAVSQRQHLSIEIGISPHQVTQKVIRDLAQTLSKHHITVDCDMDPRLTLTSDEKALYEILHNLILNAVHASSTGDSIKIEAYSSGDETIIQVMDRGKGIPPDMTSRIFEPFFTTKLRRTNSNQSGTGMGLFIVKEYVQALGGKIHLNTQQKQGTCFALSFPNLDKPWQEVA